MTLVIAHIGGIPVEETVAGFGPVVAVAGGCCIATLRARWRRARAGSIARTETTRRS